MELRPIDERRQPHRRFGADYGFGRRVRNPYPGYLQLEEDYERGYLVLEDGGLLILEGNY